MQLTLSGKHVLIMSAIHGIDVIRVVREVLLCPARHRPAKLILLHHGVDEICRSLVHYLLNYLYYKENVYEKLLLIHYQAYLTKCTQAFLFRR